MTDMTEGEMRRANFWIKRWKLVGGWFEIADESGEVTVTLARFVNKDPKQDAAAATAAAELEKELGRDHKKQANVLELVTMAYRRAQPSQDTPVAANDEDHGPNAA